MSNLLTADVVDALKPSQGVTLIITAGNTFRRDDGAGPYIASRLSPHENINVIDAGITPENIVEDAVAYRPEKIIIIDAAHFRGIPGEARLISEEQVPETTVSTHMIPLNVVSKLIASQTDSDVVYVGIQVKNVEMGEDISDEVKNTADAVVETVIDQFRK